MHQRHQHLLKRSLNYRTPIKKRITDRITELHAEEQALQRLNAARNQGEVAVRRAMIANEQDQALRRLGLDVTGAQSDEQKRICPAD